MSGARRTRDTTPTSRLLPPPLALLLALALHAALPLLARGPSIPSRPALVHDLVTEVELSLGEPGASRGPLAHQSSAAAIPPPSPPRNEGSRERPHAATARTAPSPAAPPSQEAVVVGGGDADLAPNPGSSSSEPSRAIDLGLNDGVRRAALLGGWLELPAAPGRPTDGGLRQALAARDAERGLARSSAATHAAYEAARRFAPRIGIGTFDVTADERGVVFSVTLASAPTSEGDWQRVGEVLRELLKDRRLLVPPGARGLVARLRIETGELARDSGERFRTRRGTALGQAPSHPRELRAESTRSSLEPGQLTPTLGVTIAGGGPGGSIRVVLVDERPL